MSRADGKKHWRVMPSGEVHYVTQLGEMFRCRQTTSKHRVDGHRRAVAIYVITEESVGWWDEEKQAIVQKQDLSRPPLIP